MKTRIILSAIFMAIVATTAYAEPGSIYYSTVSAQGQCGQMRVAVDNNFNPIMGLGCIPSAQYPTCHQTNDVPLVEGIVFSGGSKCVLVIPYGNGMLSGIQTPQPCTIKSVTICADTSTVAQ